MSVKISHSGINSYITCGHSYKLKYIDKIHPLYKGSALFFGSAMDEALNTVLEHHKSTDIYEKAVKVFDEKWEQQEDRTVGLISLPKYEYILYSKYDFDADLMQKSDWRELFVVDENAIEKLQHIQSELKEVEFKDLSTDDKMFYNYANWLCMRRKAHYMIDAYIKDLLPNIEEVLEVQKTLETKDDTGNKLTGIADFVCKLKPGIYGNIELTEAEIVIPDNKTSSIDYEQDSVETSPQLAKYRVMLNAEHGYNITKGAYFVIKKKFTKNTTKTCKKCGNIATGSHKTCNAVVNDKRCDGDWEKSVVVTVPTQLIVQNIPDQFSTMVMENVDSVVKAIEAEIFPRNFSACKNQYGSPCPYFNLCHKGQMKDLVKGEK